MKKNIKLMIVSSILSLLALGLGITAHGFGEFFPPGGSVVP